MSKIQIMISVNGKEITLNHKQSIQLGRMLGHITGVDRWVYQLYDQIHECITLEDRLILEQSPYKLPVVKLKKIENNE